MSDRPKDALGADDTASRVPRDSLALRLLAAEALDEARRLLEQDRRLLAVVLQDFEADPKARVRRGKVHGAVAARLQRPVSNGLCHQVKAALRLLPGFMEGTRNGKPFYLGLRPKSDAPTMPTE